MSGGQARNIALMQLFADVCEVPVVLPKDCDQAVCLGSAMLGRLAHDFAEENKKKDKRTISDMKQNQAEKLWNIMVSAALYPVFLP